MISMTRWVWLLLAVGTAPLAQVAQVAQAAEPAATASADTGAAAGAAKAATCTACHGPAGNSANPLWPNLASQNAAYIVGQLKQFKANTRINSGGVMMGMALTLDDQGMQDVAAYFSTQTLTGLEADPSYWQAGQKLYRGGDPARGIPACMACHGPSGHGNPAAAYPALRAQHSQYVVKELTDYAGGKRYSTNDKGETAGGANSAIMTTIAQRLTPEDMRNLGSYVQGLR
jgi:cytochrome c553